MAHAIEHRKNHRLRPNRRREIVHCRLQRVGFHADEDKVVRHIDLFSADELWRENGITIRADNSETIATELLRARRTNKKSHIAPRLSQSATKVTTHPTSADDEDSHSGDFVS